MMREMVLDAARSSAWGRAELATTTRAYRSTQQWHGIWTRRTGGEEIFALFRRQVTASQTENVGKAGPQGRTYVTDNSCRTSPGHYDNVDLVSVDRKKGS
ncbi:hypothetical protein DAI22_06g252600 [Oryza sativa Japonica Group]|nr:hypothetical protein DAI22_06g252600 [Oryza sativa Japonica Group]